MRRRLQTDTRAVDYGPTRLVITLTVAIAATGLIATPLGAVHDADAGEEEVTVQLSERVVTLDEDGAVVTLNVSTEAGHPVPDSAILVKSGSLPLEDGPVIRRTGPESNTVTLRLSTEDETALQPQFRPRQSRGNLEIEVVSLAGSDRTDDRQNPDLTIIDG